MYRNFNEAYEESLNCIRCGYCQQNCPTYAVSGLENAVARGRNLLAKIIHDGETELTKSLKHPIFECLLCGACTENCAPSVKTQQIMMSARAEYIKRHHQPLLQKYVFNQLLPNPDQFARLMKLAVFGKRSGLSGLAQALRVFGWIGKDLANMEGLVKNMPAKFFREKVTERHFAGSGQQPKVGYFVGCGINFAFPNVGEATLNVLTKNAYSVEILDNVCCGLPAAGYGDLEAAKTVAKKNIEIFEQSGCDIFLSDCGSCSSFLNDYPLLLKDEEDWQERATVLNKKIMDINSFLTRFELKTDFKIPYEQCVTYHDPCHLSHYLKIRQEPRSLINRIDGVSFGELPEADWCCGGAGTYNIAHYDISMKILKRKMENVKKTEASILLSSCPGCLVQLSYGAEQNKNAFVVKHITELLDESMII